MPNTESVTEIAVPDAVQQTPTPDPLQSLDAAAKQQLLLKLLAESPDMAALLATFVGKSA